MAAAVSPAHRVTSSFVASGSVSDFDADKVSSIATTFAANANVPASQVHVTVTAGSVIVQVAIDYANATAATAGTATLESGILASPAALTTALASAGVSGIASIATAAAAPFVMGHWVDNYNTYLTISADSWWSSSSTGSSASTLTIVHHGTGFLVYQNAADASFNPSLYTRIDYHPVGAGFAYCMSTYDSPTANHAINFDNSAVYNASNQGNGGCGQFSHTVVSPYTHPKRGTWLDNWGSIITITANKIYSGSTVHAIDLFTNAFMLWQNPPTASWNANLWAKTNFHDVPGGWAHCQSVMSAPTAIAALTNASYFSTYNSSETGNGGCGQFSHTTVTAYAHPKRGTWLENFGAIITVTDDTWYSVSSYGVTIRSIEMYTGAFMLWQNPSTASWNANMWAKTSFHDVPGGWAHCQEVMAAPSAVAALTDASFASVYNSSETGNGGCGQFSHTTVTPYTLPLIGSWTSNYNENIVITATTWTNGASVSAIEMYTNGIILMQNPADATFNPSLWSKVEYHAVANGGYAFCTSVYNGVSAAAALTTDTSASYNATETGNGGCGQFAHTILTPAESGSGQGA